MPVDPLHEALHDTAQELCLSLSVADVEKLGGESQEALMKLAMFSGVTNVSWWRPSKDASGADSKQTKEGE